MTVHREILPPRRRSENFAVVHGNHRTNFHVTLGYYPDGRIGEVFVSGAKAGSEVEAVARDGAVLLSLALQHGILIATMRAAVTRDADGTASTIIGKVIDNLESA